MIRSGKKTEEYREVKEYWITRLCNSHLEEWEGRYDFRPITHIKFTNGYSLTSPSFTIECKGIRIGRGNPEWGAPTDRDVFILSLDKIVEHGTTSNPSTEEA